MYAPGIVRQINKAHHLPLDLCVIIIIHVTVAFGVGYNISAEFIEQNKTTSKTKICFAEKNHVS